MSVNHGCVCVVCVDVVREMYVLKCVVCMDDGGGSGVEMVREMYVL